MLIFLKRLKNPSNMTKSTISQKLRRIRRLYYQNKFAALNQFLIAFIQKIQSCCFWWLFIFTYSLY